jgi:hypothetical protein
MSTAARETIATRSLAHLTRSADGIHPDCTATPWLTSTALAFANVYGLELALKIRSRKFDGRCARHRRYNPAVDGRGGVKGGCARCELLFEIWEASLKLNQLIRRFDPGYDDLVRPKEPKPLHDPRQLSLI